MNEYFKRTSKKLDIGYLESLSKTKGGGFTHYYHKFDGTHADLHWYKGEPIKFITREGNDVSHLVPYLVEALENHKYMEAYEGVYACELVNLDVFMNNPKDTWSATRRALGVKEYKGNLENYVHCIIYDVYDRDKESVEHLTYLERLFIKMPSVGEPCKYNEYVHSINDLKGFYIPQKLPIHTLPEAWETHIVTAKREGFVVFNINAEVKWEHTFNKLKPGIDVDCVVTGYNLGAKGKQHDGKLGAFDISLYKDGKLVSIGKCPTMTQSERDRWTERMLNNDKTPYVIQVHASEVTTGFKLRFPSYVRERTDKKPEECLWGQLD